MLNMKKKIFHTLFLLIAFLLSGELSAQAILGVRSISFPDTVFTNTNYTVEVIIENKGNSPYTGIVNVYYTTDTTASNQFLDSVTVTNLDSSDVVQLVVNNFQFNSTAFLFGGNIVVVWPTGSVATADSATTPVYVIDDTGIKDGTGINENIYIFPNPVKNKLFINCYDIKNSIEQVRIYNLIGKEIFKSEESPGVINTDNYRQGIYFMELRLKDGTQVIKKFIKSSS